MAYMHFGQILSLILTIGLIILALSFRPLRKTIGLLMVIVGGILCFTVIGAVFGIPMIVVGGLFLFI